MKLERLHKIMYLPSLIFVAYFLGDSPSFGQEIELTNIQTSPSNINVGDSIQINATIVNNSSNTIYFNGGCLSPLSATFDKNVVVGKTINCLAIFHVTLKSGQNTTVVGPSHDNSYVATLPGTTNANVMFSYDTENKSKNTVSKLFAFDISERTHVPEFSSIPIVIFALSIMSSIILVSWKNHKLFKL